MNNSQIRYILTRLSVAIIFIGIGLWEIIQPSYWATYFPTFITKLSYVSLVIAVHGGILVIIGIAVLLGIYLRYTSILAALMMIIVIVALLTSFGFTDIIIRDLAVLVVTIALFFDDTNYLRLKK